jgi:DNA-binding transcriptional ArsR family regulator
MMMWKEGEYSNIYRRLLKLPPSAKFILYILNEKRRELSRKELINQTLLSSRTIGHSLKILLEMNLIERKKPRPKKGSYDRRLVKYVLK